MENENEETSKNNNDRVKIRLTAEDIQVINSHLFPSEKTNLHFRFFSLTLAGKVAN